LPEDRILEAAIRNGLAEILGGEWNADGLRADEKSAAEELEGHYLDREWTWRV
jgi:hypothetical protein